MVKKKGARVSAFTRSATPFHPTPPFLGHPYPARLALLGWGREEEKKAVVRLLCSGQPGGISDLRLGRFLDFNSCFLIAGNERIYERL